MDDLTPYIVVHALAGTHVQVEAALSFGPHPLIALGFSPAPHIRPNYWTCPVGDDAHRLFLVRELLGWGALFSEGKEWSPAELLELYFEQGKINLAWKTVYWTGPGQSHIRALPRAVPPGSPSFEPTPPRKQQSCPVCRAQVRKLCAAPDSLPEILTLLGGSAYRFASLYKCKACSVFWEVLDRHVAEMTEAQAREFYPLVFGRWLAPIRTP